MMLLDINGWEEMGVSIENDQIKVHQAETSASTSISLRIGARCER